MQTPSLRPPPAPGRADSDSSGVAGGYSAPAAVCQCPSMHPEAADGPGCAHAGGPP